MNVGVLASQVVPQWAPPSPRPHALVGCMQHLADRVEVLVREVQQRPHHERPALVGQQEVVVEVEHLATLTGGRGP